MSPRVESGHRMILVRPCVEHALALVSRLQVVIMLAAGPAAITSSILAAAPSSTIRMCLPAAVSLLQMLVKFGRSLQ